MRLSFGERGDPRFSPSLDVRNGLVGVKACATVHHWARNPCTGAGRISMSWEAMQNVRGTTRRTLRRAAGGHTPGHTSGAGEVGRTKKRSVAASRT